MAAADQQSWFDSSAAKYDKMSGIINKTTFDHILKTCSAEEWKSAHVLDYGCGTGTMALHLAPLVASVTGVDVSKGMLERMQGKVEAAGLKNVTWHALSLEGEGSTVKEVVPAGTKFDVVYVCYVLHHVANVAKALTSMIEVLKPGGRLIVCEFPPGDDSEHDAKLPQLQGAEQAAGFTKDGLSELFSKHGLAEIHVADAFEIEIDADAFDQAHDGEHHEHGHGHEHHAHGHGHEHHDHEHGHGHEHHDHGHEHHEHGHEHHDHGHEHHEHGHEHHDHGHEHHEHGHEHHEHEHHEHGHEHHEHAHAHGHKHAFGRLSEDGKHRIMESVLATGVLPK